MDNISKFQDYVAQYFEKQISSFYTFEVWKDVLVLLRKSQKSPDAFKKFNVFGRSFNLLSLTADVRASNDEWAPCLNLVYVWRNKDFIVSISFMLVKAQLTQTQILDMRSVYKHYSDSYDFVDAFEKTVVLMNVLRG